jgi:hypothetical protein
MGHFAVALPAGAIGSGGVMVIYKAHHPGIRYLILMAADAVALDHGYGRAQGFDHLRLGPKGEDGGMIQAILGFKKVFIEHIVLRYVAVVAMGYLAVGAVVPGNVLGGHQVAVHTGLGVVGKIGNGIAHLKHIGAQAGHNGHQKSCRRPPSSGRHQAVAKKEPFNALKKCHYLLLISSNTTGCPIRAAQVGRFTNGKNLIYGPLFDSLNFLGRSFEHEKMP